MAKLGDICIVQAGGTPSRSVAEYWQEGNIPWVKISDFNGKHLKSTEEYITRLGLEKSSAKLFEKGTILYTIFATLGEVSVLDIDAATNQAIAGLKLIDTSVSLDYLYYFLVSKKEEVNRIGRGVAQNNINLGILKNFEIPLISTEEQKNIVVTLNKLNDCIELRKQQLSKLDELVKSRFIEMFGDPIINSKHLPEKILIDVVMLQRGFDLPTQNRVSSGDVPVYGSNGVLDFHDKSRCSSGVITGRSGTIGKVYYCKNDYWPLNTTLFSVDTKGNNIVYLAYLLNYYNLARFYDGTGVPTLNRNVVHKQKIIDVPLDLQNQFATFVEQTDKLKSEIKESLEKLETLKKSLMQKYFG